MTKHIQLTEVLSIGFVHLYAFSISIPKGVWALFCLCVCVCVFVCSTPEQEQLMVMWLSWMIKEEEYFERWDKSLGIVEHYWTDVWMNSEFSLHIYVTSDQRLTNTYHS